MYVIAVPDPRLDHKPFQDAADQVLGGWTDAVFATCSCIDKVETT